MRSAWPVATAALGITAALGPVSVLAVLASGLIKTSQLWLVKKAGVQVTSEELRVAVDRYAREFSDDHPEAVSCYDEIRASPKGDAIEKILMALASSPTARVTTRRLAESTQLSDPDLRTLLRSEPADLVEEVDAGWRLAVRQFWTFIEARRYLTAHQPIQPESEVTD